MQNVAVCGIRIGQWEVHYSALIYVVNYWVLTSSLVFTELTWHSEMKRKSSISFAFPSFFRNFVRNRRISLYKGSLGDWGKMGLRIGDRTQFRILPPKGRSVALQSAINCIKEHPMLCQQPYYDSSSGAKLRISEQNTKFIWVLSNVSNFETSSQR